MGEPKMRTVCHFSCGAASAVASKIALAEGPATIINAFIQEEHEDNARFMADFEEWAGVKVTRLQDHKFGSSTLKTWTAKRYIKGPLGAPCSTALKRDVLGGFARPGDINILGFTAEEVKRFDSLCDRFPGETFRAPLIERGISKAACLETLSAAGIALPAMYLLGYANNNCIGCCKGGQGYWQKIRRDFPERFYQIQLVQDSIGPGAGFLRFRSGPRLNERMMLSELPIESAPEGPEDFSCSFHCQMELPL